MDEHDVKLAQVSKQILQSMEGGKAAEELLPLVYDELRRLAAAKLAQQRPGQTLQATALVHEAYLRLVKRHLAAWANRRHFFRAAALAMQRILVEVARRKQTVRHGGGRQPVDLDSIQLAAQTPADDFLQVHEALERLATEDPLKAEVVRLKYFVGMENSEIAELTGLSLRTIERYWSYSRAWLSREIEVAK